MSVSVHEFCFTIAAHAHGTVVLSILMLGTLSDDNAAAVAEQGANPVFEFHNCMFVVHKVLREDPILQERVEELVRKADLYLIFPSMALSGVSSISSRPSG
jgi:hypothetical protein